MSSEYQLICFDVPNEQKEEILGLLYKAGCLGLEEQEASGNGIRIRAYFDGQNSTAALRQELSAILTSPLEILRIGLSDFSFQPQPFEPIELCKNIWIVPPDDMISEKKAASGLQIILRPGMGFGTGRHESTQLAAQAIQELIKGRGVNSLLDLGTGSGILALLARKLGVQKVQAVEIDEQACENALENFSLNQMDSIPLFRDFSQVGGTFDVVVANILTPTHLHLRQEMEKHLTQGGFLILSGVTHNEDSQIESAFGHLMLVDKRDLNGWLCYTFRKH